MTTTTNALDTSKYEDIYNIICSYALNNKVITTAFKSTESNNSDIYEFINTAFVYYIDHLYKSYDESKGALSTHIYASLKNIFPVILMQSKFNVSNCIARRLCDGSEKGKQNKKRLRNMYANPTYIDCCDSSLNYETDSNSDDDRKARCLDLADENNEIENCENEINNKDALSAFYSCLDRYMTRTKEEFRERNRNMIIDYTFSTGDTKTTLKTLSDKYNITRERARQITTKFYEYAQHDSTLRDLLYK